jgi:Mce-associated membrane protein
MAKHADAHPETLSETELPDASVSDRAESSSESATFDEEVAEAVPVSEAAVAEAGAADGGSEAAVASRKPRSPVRLATVLGLVFVVSLAALAGWLGFRMHHSQQAQEQRDLFVGVARQGAVNLTTIDWQHADADVQRILDSATGTFYDDFSHRSRPFIDVVKKAQSKSVGTITEAGLESQSGDEAQVLVAVSVDTTSLGTPQDPRHWRMRITVQKAGSDVKVSNVAFVP